MMNRRFLGMLLAGAMSLSAMMAAPALAKSESPRGTMAHAASKGGGAHGASMDKMFERLNLSAEQREKIKTIRQQNHAQTKSQREQLMTKRKELHALIRSASSTREQAIAKQREVNVLQDQLSENRLNTWFEMRGVLSPEQLSQLEAFKPQKRGPKR